MHISLLYQRIFPFIRGLFTGIFEYIAVQIGNLDPSIFEIKSPKNKKNFQKPIDNCPKKDYFGFVGGRSQNEF